MNHRISYRIIFLFPVLWAGSVCSVVGIQAQTVTLQGIITDESTKEPLAGANVVLRKAGEERARGAATDPNGFYQIGGIEPGEYALRISYVGYEAYADTLQLGEQPRVTLSIALALLEGVLDDVVVTVTEGAARLEGGRQRIVPENFGNIPTPSGSGDLANYLQSLPGVVAAGDRGGQLFVRGGTPSENMVLVDGLLIYRPFHILGFFSAFPEDLVSGADFYAGGFGPRYSGRTSSVLDVRFRDGNRNRHQAAASLSPFLGEVVVEGPVRKERSSFLASVRSSFIEQTAPLLSGDDFPVAFGSQFFKLSHAGRADSRCSVMAVHTYDRGRLDPELADQFRWNNVVAGGQCVVLPENSPGIFEINTGISSIRNSTGIPGDPERSAGSTRFQLHVHHTRIFRRIQAGYGFFSTMEWLTYDLREQFQGVRDGSGELMSVGGYIDTALPLGEQAELKPGAVFTIHKDTYRPSLEPRLRFTWSPGGKNTGELNTSIGLYHQALSGITDDRDAGSPFMVWMPVPLGDSQIKVWHMLLGWRQSLGGGFDVSVEGYHKRLENYPVALWGSLARFTTKLALADGRVYGGDIRLEFSRRYFYTFIGYGYSFTKYRSSQEHFNTWFGEPVRRYHPAHDRRHQISSVIGLQFDSFRISTRWQFGSGLPFTRPLGFDDWIRFDRGLPDITGNYGTPRVILDRPYNGRLPGFHRLDVSAEYGRDVPFAELIFKAGIVNAYNRRNLFYYDVYRQRRIDQMPFAPYISLKVKTR